MICQHPTMVHIISIYFTIIKSCLIYEESAVLDFSDMQQLCYFLVESQLVCIYILIGTWNSQSIKTFLSHGVSDVCLCSAQSRLLKQCSDSSIEISVVSRLLFPVVCALLTKCFWVVFFHHISKKKDGFYIDKCLCF